MQWFAICGHHLPYPFPLLHTCYGRWIGTQPWSMIQLASPGISLLLMYSHDRWELVRSDQAQLLRAHTHTHAHTHIHMHTHDLRLFVFHRTVPTSRQCEIGLHVKHRGWTARTHTRPLWLVYYGRGPGTALAGLLLPGAPRLAVLQTQRRAERWADQRWGRLVGDCKEWWWNRVWGSHLRIPSHLWFKRWAEIPVAARCWFSHLDNPNVKTSTLLSFTQPRSRKPYI